MLEIIPASRRFSEDLGWLKTNWLFSFSHYYDPANLQFGALRVFNDDVVMPGGGFPDHPHANFEIVTVVLEGEIAHRDDMGNETSVKAGEIQRMSAGRGVIHSEFNRSTAPVHLYQLWFLPSVKNAKPSYAQAAALPQKPGNVMTLLVGGISGDAPLSMDAEADIYAGFLKKGSRISHSLASDVGLFGYVGEGKIQIGEKVLGPGDQFRVTDEKKISFEASEETRLLLIHTKI